MAIIRFTAGVLLAFLFLIFTGKIIYAEASTFNLVPNYSFESGDNFPTNWTVSNEQFCNQQTFTGSLETYWNNSLSYSGFKSFGFVNINLPRNSDAPHTRIISDFIEVPLNQRFKVFGRATTSENSTGLAPIMEICSYDNAGNPLYHDIFSTTFTIDNKYWYSFGHTYQYFFAKSKIKIALSLSCYHNWLYSPPCFGSIWFDNIVLEPIGNITAHVFEDLNKNGLQDEGEPNLARHPYRVSFYREFNCYENNIFINTPTDTMGNAIAKDVPLGSYSAKQDFTYLQGWLNTTPSCQNISLENASTTPIYIGVVRAPPFPYFSQKDPAWGSQEYDSANTFGPFFCGTTLAQCGCATTSSAMLLKYYGVDKSPAGDLTNPKSLNNWLKQNNGYAFGAVKWNSIAAYSVKANQAFNTQKIKFSGYGSANDFSTLDTELASDRPTILQEPGHFIVASQKQGSDYSIADPAWENKTTLAAYSNSFQSMRRFEKTNTDLSAIFIATPAPTELLITDSQGRITGKDASGNIFNQIPNSHYALEPAFSDPSSENPQAPPENLGVNTLVILAPDLQNYTLETFSQSPAYSIEFSGYDEDGDITVQNFEQAKADQFDINYSENGNNFEFFQTVEIDARHSAKSNPFNPSARILPVSILASWDFDPQTIDINTIETDPGWNLLKASTILIGPRLQDEKSLLLLLESSGNYQEEICIRGKTLSGIPFRGCDAITVVGNDP